MVLLPIVLVLVVLLDGVSVAHASQAQLQDEAAFSYDTAAHVALGGAGRPVGSAAAVAVGVGSPEERVSVAGRLYDSTSTFVAPRVTSWLDDAATAKVPDGWGPGRPNNSSVGTRWTDPTNQGNGIRIDQGNPLNTQATQQVDHVVVRSGGEVLGRDGRPIVGSIKDNYDIAHIPLDEWLTWSSWNSP